MHRKLKPLDGIKFNKSEKNVNVFCNSNKIQFFEFQTSSGIDLIIHRDKSKPLAELMLLYKVGARDEAPNERGIAHLFEHLMFQGSNNVKKSEHFKYVLNAGGITNAFTSHDFTAYFEIVPTNHIETCLWLESDRLYSLDLSEENLQNQKDVVIEEKMQNYDNAPYGMYLFKILKNLFGKSSYEYPVIGYAEDIRNFSLEGALSFHNRYYRPDNMIMMVAGDIDPEGVLSLVEKYFGEKKQGEFQPNKYSDVSPLQNTVEEEMHDNITQPALYINYATPGAVSKELMIAYLFSAIFSNSLSSRLYRRLVYKDRKAKSLNTSVPAWELASIFMTRVNYSDPKNRDYILGVFDSEIGKVISEGISKKEFEKAKNQFEFNYLHSLSNLKTIALESVISKFYFGDTDRINNFLEDIESISLDEVHSFVNKYLSEANRYVLNYIPGK